MSMRSRRQALREEALVPTPRLDDGPRIPGSANDTPPPAPQVPDTRADKLGASTASHPERRPEPLDSGGRPQVARPGARSWRRIAPPAALPFRAPSGVDSAPRRMS